MKEILKKYRLQIVVGAVITLLLAIFLFVMLFLPGIIARSALASEIEPFQGLGEEDVVEIFMPNYREGDYVTDVSVVYESEEARSLVKKIVELCGGAEYERTDVSKVGHWDTSVAVRYDKSIARVYFCRDVFYVAEDNTRYVFSVSDGMADKYGALIDELEKIIADAA